jgi:hypothetical protein
MPINSCLRADQRSSGMVVKFGLLRNLLWFCTIMLVALSFPIQVYSQSPYPALLPYALFAVIVALPRKRLSRAGRARNANMVLMIGIYAVLVLLNTTWQTLFGEISAEEGINAIVVYLLPVAFYWYFSSVASEQEIRWSFVAMVVAGLVVGIYFTYDSYIKLALQEVSSYSQAAFDYSASRAGANANDVNEARISVGYRSHGLLESHSVSGAWIIIGALAALALTPVRRGILRKTIILSFGSMVLMGLNFTAIIAFSIIMFLLEFGGFSAARAGKASLVGSLISLTLVVGILAGIVLWGAGNEMAELIVAFLSFQSDLALGTGGGDLTFWGLITQNTDIYVEHIASAPALLLIGDGFSTFGTPKGGDIGAIETLARFGLPYFVAILFCIFRLIRSGLREIKIGKDKPCATGSGTLVKSRILVFSIGVTLLVVITDVHYTVWPAKSVLPIVFLVLALYGRYLPDRRCDGIAAADLSGRMCERA